MNIVSRLLLALVVLPISMTYAHERTVTIGILALRNKAEVATRWQPLADYLSEKLPGKKIQLLTLSYAELTDKTRLQQLDFILTSSSHYIYLRETQGLSGVLATISEQHDGQPLNAYGGAIFCRKDRNDINQLTDLKHKNLAAINTISFGGYQMQLYELKKAGIQFPNDAKLMLIGEPQDSVISTVLSGKADAGFIRSGLLEELAREGKLDLSQIKIINSQNTAYPFALSTHLYPEWALAALPHVDANLARLVIAYLLIIGPHHPAAQAGNFYGFTIPADYSPVEALLREMRFPPFDTTPTFTLKDVWLRYQLPLMLLATAGVVIGVLIILLLRINRSERRVRNQAQESALQLRTIIETEPECVKTLASDGSLLQMNQAGLNMIEADSLQQVLGKQVYDIVDTEYQEAFNNMTKQVFAGETGNLTFKITGFKGTPRWLDSHAVPLRDTHGNITALLSVTRDITERKAIEDELKRSNAELEQFAYAISHDMRQPLRMITSYMTLIEKALAEQLDDNTRQYFFFAIDGAKRMDQMILALLDYSRVGRKTEIKTHIASRTAVDEALLFLKPALEVSGGSVEISGDWPELIASRDELTRLLQNLIGNALKYHEPNQPPQVEVHASQLNNSFRVEVRDRGIGIDPDQIGRLFNVFSRLQSRSRFEGSGVGLALCRKIVEHHGGNIGVNSAGEGHGSVFWFELPIQPSHFMSGENNVA
ncbi:MAG: PhnD/SsuA/transferrin family substrate-binding protein [Methylococcales bacterium]|nr:PhnD/SsuA/transferrin family substrate-binding protein [Methylococcales bacterium]